MMTMELDYDDDDDDDRVERSVQVRMQIGVAIESCQRQQTSAVWL